MSMDLTGITNQNEYYTNHYFSSIFEESVKETISKWRTEAKDDEKVRTPWSLLRDVARQYYPIHDRFLRSKFDTQTLANIRTLADMYLSALGYPESFPELIDIDDTTRVPVYLELNKPNGAPAMWILLATSDDKEAAILDKFCFSVQAIGEEGLNAVSSEILTSVPNEDLITKILFGQVEPPRFILLIGMNQIALIDRNKWNEKRYLQFELEEIFSRHEESTLQAMAVLLHRSSLCPEEGTALLDELDANSQKNAAGVSKDLKYALRECIELLGNEVLYDMSTRQGRDLNADPVDAGLLTIECLRYMYRMLFMLFIEARPELGYAPIKTQSYLTGYSLESLRNIADDIRDDIAEVGGGYYLHETLAKLYDLIYNGYPETEEKVIKYSQEKSLHDMFVIAPLKAHIFDPEYTKMIANSKIRNSVMLRIIDLMSLTRETGKRNERRGRISYANLGINQMGSVYEALLSYRGFIAENTLFEVKRAGDDFNELDVGYFVTEKELEQYTQEERVRYDEDDPNGKYKKGQLRKYDKGTFIYRLAGREREKSASYYTHEVLTKCLVKHALKELLEGKTADEILHLTICEPAMGSAAFLNEGINQIAEAYLDKKQKELDELISAENRQKELQKVKMYIADNNVFGIDLNPVAVELAEVSLWLNTIYEGGYVPWFGTQLVNGNSLIGARRQVYHKNQLVATSKKLRWYENAPEHIPFIKLDSSGRNIARSRYQVYHFLTGDPGMCNYTDNVIKALEPEKIKSIKEWNKQFTTAYSEDEFKSLIELSKLVDALWKDQIEARQELEKETITALDVYGYKDKRADTRRTIREKDKLLRGIYKSEHAKNAGSYARLKFAMDYWCSLWFWPIDQADLLPKRSEFISEMDFILRGTMQTNGEHKQLSFIELGDDDTPIIQNVDLDLLCDLFPRLALVRDISEKHHFMHWELEFADLFAEHGGFDLIIGNPPWVKIWWNEQSIIADSFPIAAVRKLKASEVSRIRSDFLSVPSFKELYFEDYTEVSGMQNFLNSTQNYHDLKGTEINLYKYFRPQSTMFSNGQGVFSFIHPTAIFDEVKGGNARTAFYSKLKKCFKFVNEDKLFSEVGNTVKYSLCVYSNVPSSSFDLVCELHNPEQLEKIFESQQSRIISVDTSILKLFATTFDNSDKYEEARLPSIIDVSLLDVLRHFSAYNEKVCDIGDDAFGTTMWSETDSLEKGQLKEESHFPENGWDSIISGPLIGVSNPLYQSAKRICDTHRAFDNVDLSLVHGSYYTRCKYRPQMAYNDLKNQIPITGWGTSYDNNFKILLRRRLGQNQERTLISAIFPKGVTHVNTVTGITLKNIYDLALLQGELCTIIFDGYIKILKKDDLYFEGVSKMPLLHNSQYADDIVIRSLLLNCLTENYSELWDACVEKIERVTGWSKTDNRLKSDLFLINRKWNEGVPARTDFQRHQLMIELDCLVAQALGISLETLKQLYRIQFPVMQQYEMDTWYDANGRIVFTNNRGLSNIGFSRPEWENGIVDAPAGRKFYRNIIDDTMPDGPVERTIEYVAPFDRCNREQDYETAWKFFQEKYKDLK